MPAENSRHSAEIPALPCLWLTVLIIAAVRCKSIDCTLRLAHHWDKAGSRIQALADSASVATMAGGSPAYSMSPPSSPPQQQQLPPALQLHVLSFMTPNEVAVSGRLVSPDAAAALTGPDYCTVSISQPLPPHAAPWAQAGWQQHTRQLSLSHKLQLLTTAATSGSEVNLEVALALLQPSVFPELLHDCHTVSQPHDISVVCDPGAAAVRAGHSGLLRWLLHHCPARVSPEKVLEAAAGHCNLAGLQLAWRLLRVGCGSGGSNGLRCPVLDEKVLNAAAESLCPDALAKMAWVLAKGGTGCRLQSSTAAAAARSGDLRRLRWLCDRGCPVRGNDVLLEALEHADLTVCRWLVDKAGCKLPQAGTAGGQWAPLFLASARSADCVRKWQWLRDRGALQLSPSPQLLLSLACEVIQHGRVEGLRALQLFPGVEPTDRRQVLQRALDQAEGPGCNAVALHLWQEGYVLTHKAYTKAAAAGDLGMVRWLACEAGVPMGPMGLGELIESWPRDTVSRSRDLLQAVQLLAGEVGHQDVNTEAAVYTAVRQGHIAVAQYLLQLVPGYRPGAELVHAALASGCEALLEWLVEQPGCRAALEQASSHAYQGALLFRDRGMLTTLRRLGVPWGGEGVLVLAVTMGCEISVLRWLVEQGAPVGSVEGLAEALEQALRHGSLSRNDAMWVMASSTWPRHPPAVVPLWVAVWEWLQQCFAAVAAAQWWSCLWRLLLGWW